MHLKRVLARCLFCHHRVPRASRDGAARTFARRPPASPPRCRNWARPTQPPPPMSIPVDSPSSAARAAVSPSSKCFLRADIVVKAVMVLLLLASLWSWAIIFNKWIALARPEAQGGASSRRLFWSGQSLDELYQQFAARNDHPMAAMFVAALREWRRAFEGGAPRGKPGRRHQGTHRQGDERHHPARDRRHRAAAGLSRHRRLGVALHRPVRHGVGHHEQLHRHRRAP